MTKLTKCKGLGCPLKETCFRFRVEPKQEQEYFGRVPLKGEECGYYIKTA